MYRCIFVFFLSTVEAAIRIPVPSGDVCHIPFMHEGELQYRCVGEGNETDTDFPWCYTKLHEDNPTRHRCQSDCVWSSLGREYAGDLSADELGRPCARWDDPTRRWPGQYINPATFPDYNLTLAGAGCRNPDRDLRPWCVLDWGVGDDWQHCNPSQCPANFWCDTKWTLFGNTPVMYMVVTSAGPSAKLLWGNGQIWCPSTADTRKFASIGFYGRNYIIRSLAIRGTQDDYVTSFYITFEANWQRGYLKYRQNNMDKIFAGQTNGSVPAVAVFDPPLMAGRMRVYPVTWQNRPCMELLMVGCPEYTGQECRQGHNCQNGARCIDSEGFYWCYCLPRWTGQFCEVAMDPCISKPCENGGTCTPFGDTYVCDCLSMYSGDTCQHGEAPTCEHILRYGGGTTMTQNSGMYTINLYSDILPQGCTFRNVLTNGRVYDTAKVQIPYMLLSACQSLCMADPECAVFTFRGVWCRTYRLSAYSKLIISWNNQPTLYYKECTMGTKLYCGFTNPLWVETRIDVQNRANRGANGWEAARGRRFPVSYYPVTAAQLKKVSAESRCRQYMRLDCLRSNTDAWGITAFDGSVLNMRSWNMEHNCQCAMPQFCPNQQECRCRAQPGSWTHDRGYVETLDHVPIAYMLSGDTGAGNENARFYLREARCWTNTKRYNWEIIAGKFIHHSLRIGYHQNTQSVAECHSYCTRKPGCHSASWAARSDKNCHISTKNKDEVPASQFASHGPSDYYQPYEDMCHTLPCKNGGTCVSTLGTYTCTCLSMYSGTDCEIGYARSCVDVAENGGGITINTGYYAVKLYHDLVTDGNAMVKLFDVGTIATTPATTTPGQTEAACLSACLADIDCLAATHDPITSDCGLYHTIPSAYILAGQHYNTSVHFKELTQSGEVHCDFTDTDYPRTTLPLHSTGPRDLITDNQTRVSASALLYHPFTTGQITALLNDSMSCEQRVIVKCYRTTSASWGLMNAEGVVTQLDYIGLDGHCNCLLQDVCQGQASALPCRCAADDQTWHTDQGLILEKSQLPVTQLVTQDSLYEGAMISIVVQDLMCRQSIQVLDECLSKPCLNNATCVDKHFEYECQCPAGYTGLRCETEIDECESIPCQFNSSCIDFINEYTCNCTEGYTGVHCETEIDECQSSPCATESTCEDQVAAWLCHCAPGYTGPTCHIDIDECSSVPCEHGANCTDNVNSYTCQCEAGYTGVHCETDIDECASNPCQFNSTCKNTTLDEYSCDCLEGYTGVNCETEIDECQSSPCATESTCEDQVAAWLCHCAPGYTGPTCHIDIDECSSGPCENGANCTDTINIYTCQCEAGYTGVHCETDVDECASLPCQNGATCVDEVDGYVCNCITGYIGTHCETDVDECASGPCAGDATCVDRVAGWVCVCPPGYTGIMCQADVNECDSVPCQHGGSCFNLINGYTCLCLGTGFTGTLCESELDECASSPCRHDATCIDVLHDVYCFCATGYSGHFCQIEINECASNPCANGASCVEAVAGYTCTCPAGYTGDSCQTDVTSVGGLCNSSPCLNGATCIGGNGFYVCRCPYGFSGIHCQHNLGSWEQWTLWSACSVTCGVGSRWRQRLCDLPGSDLCVGDSIVYTSCTLQDCGAVECGLWEAWGGCSTTCGAGQQVRDRWCITQEGYNFSQYDAAGCHERACEDQRLCHSCSGEVGVAGVVCGAQQISCSSGQELCTYIYNHTGRPDTVSLQKGCASLTECNIDSSEKCKKLHDQTIGGLRSNEMPAAGALSSNGADSVLQMVTGNDECRICCTQDLCNEGALPQAAALYLQPRGDVTTHTPHWAALTLALTLTLLGRGGFLYLK